jgi:hypothetical protein
MGFPAFFAAILGIIVSIPKKKDLRTFLLKNSASQDILLILAYLIPYTIVVLNPANLFRSEELLVPI